MSARWLFDLRRINLWYLASAIALNLFWTLGVGLVLSAQLAGLAQSDPGNFQLILLIVSFLGPFLIGFLIGRMAADGRGPTYGLFGSFGSVGVLLVVAIPSGVVGLMMIVAAIAGGLNGGMASVRNR